MADIRPFSNKHDDKDASKVESGPVSQKSETPVPSVVKPTANQDYFRSDVIPAQSDRDKKAQESNDEIGAMIHKQEQTVAQTGLGAQDVPHTVTEDHITMENNRMKAQAEADRQKQEAVAERHAVVEAKVEHAEDKWTETEHAANPLKQIHEHFNSVLYIARDMPNSEELAILVQSVLAAQRQLVVLTKVK